MRGRCGRATGGRAGAKMPMSRPALLSAPGARWWTVLIVYVETGAGGVYARTPHNALGIATAHTSPVSHMTKSHKQQP